MTDTSCSVLLFSFHDPTRVSDVLDAARGLPGLRHLVVLGCSPDRVVRLTHALGGPRPVGLEAVAATVGASLRSLAAPGRVLRSLDLTGSAAGCAAFGRLVCAWSLSVAVVACDSAAPSTKVIAEYVDAVVRPRSGVALAGAW